MEYKLILNTSFITLNEYIKAERSHKYVAAAIKLKQTSKVHYLARSLKFTLPENKKFDVEFNWYKPNNKTDHDNIAFAKKFILDGLVISNILKSDGAKYINNFTDNFILDKSRLYISCVVIFKEISK